MSIFEADEHLRVTSELLGVFTVEALRGPSHELGEGGIAMAKC